MIHLATEQSLELEQRRQANVLRVAVLEFVEAVGAADIETVFEIGSELGLIDQRSAMHPDRRRILWSVSRLLAEELTRRGNHHR